MWNPYGFFPFPVSTNMGNQPNEDQVEKMLKLAKRFKKLMKADEDAAKKKKEDEKKKEGAKVCDVAVSKVATLLLLTMPITGPIYLICMAVMWHLVKVSLQ